MFDRSAVFEAFSTFVRKNEEGGATDSRRSQLDSYLAHPLGQVSAVYDDVLQGFVGDPATFAAMMSCLAGARLPPSKLEELSSVKSIKALRKLTMDIDPFVVQTEHEPLRIFLQTTFDLGKDGRAWVLLVAGHLSSLRTDSTARAFIYPFNKKES